MTRERLNYLMILDVHRDNLEQIDLNVIGEKFIAGNKTRLKVFGHFCS